MEITLTYRRWLFVPETEYSFHGPAKGIVDERTAPS